MKKVVSLLLIVATFIFGPQTIASAATSSTAANGIVYTNSKAGFSLTLPASWKEQYSVIPSATCVSFLHKESAEQTGRESGVLFSIIRYDGKLAEKDVVGAGTRYLVAQTNEYSYVLAYPSGVEYTDAAKAGYQKLEADIDKIGKTVKTVPITDRADPTYRSYLKFNENGLTNSRVYTFANGSVDAAPGDCLLMLNGEFSDAHVIIKNNCALVPVSVISEACEARVNWGYQDDNGGIYPYGSDCNSSNMPLIIEIHNADESIDIKMTVGRPTADVNGKTEALDAPPFIENNTAYVPLCFVCDLFNKANGSLLAGRDAGDPRSAKSLAFHSIVWVDDYAAKPTVDTLTWLKAQMDQAFTSLEKNSGAVLKGTDPNDPSFSQLADDINHTYYVGNVGRYALYQGPYPTLVDVNTKTIYFETVSSGSGWSIWKANMSDPETFLREYFAG